MYSQKQSYQLVKDGYRLSTKNIVVRKIIKDTNKIIWSIQHIWRCKFKRRIIITSEERFTTELPDYFFVIRKTEVGAYNYFQMDDSSYTVESRGLIKNCTPKLIEYLTKNNILKL